MEDKKFITSISLAVAIVIISVISALVLGTILSSSALECTDITNQSNDSILVESTSALSPVGSGISSSEVKANNDTWLDFDGSDDSVTMSLGATNGTDQTFSLWVKHDGNTCTPSTFFGKDSAYRFELDPSCFVDIVSQNTAGTEQYLSNIAETNTTEWINVVLVINSTHSLGYVNGTFIKDIAQVGVNDTGNDLHIGGNVSGEFFKGSVDNIRIYNRSLSASEITEIYNSGVQTNSSLPSNGLVLLYSFDEASGSTTHDISSNSNDGIIIDATWVAQGQYFAEFNGASSYVKTDTDVVNGLSATTIAAWVYLNDGGQQVAPQIAGENNEAWIHYHTGAGNFRFRTDDAGAGFAEAVTGPTISTKTWYHIVGTYDGSDVSIYLNGVFNDSNSLTGNIGDDSQTYKIGADLSLDGYFNGNIDEVLTYNRALSGPEVATLFGQYEVTSTGINRTGTPSTTGLELDINFDDKSSIDRTGNENNGININVGLGLVYNVLRPLTETIDYTIISATGLFTIVNTGYSWAELLVSWSYITGESCPSGVNPEDVSENFGAFVTGLLGFLGIIGIVLGVVWLIMYVAKLFSKGGLNDLSATA